YDGEYGVIRLFEESELKRLTAGGLLFDAPISKLAASARPKPRVRNDALADNRESVAPARPRLRLISGDSAASSLLAQLARDPRAAAEADAPLLIVAGPGSGKTRTLTYRIAYLVAERGVEAERCLAI